MPATPPSEELNTDTLAAFYRAASDDPALDGVDDLDWPALSAVYGFGPAEWANDLTAYLRATLSPIADHRNFAFQLLHEILTDQGVVTAASVHAAPFLYNLLESPHTPDRSAVAQLLASMASSHHHSQWEELTRVAVGSKLDLLYPYLANPDSGIRWTVARALACYPERVAEIQPLLEAALANETEPIYQKALRQDLAQLTGDYSALPQVRNASQEPVERHACPRCASWMFLARNGQMRCPVCGETANPPPPATPA